MDFMTFLTKLIEACVWPGLIIFILIKYKLVILKLIESLSSIKIGNYVDAKFSRETSEVANESRKEVEINIDEKQELSGSSLEELPPRLAILDSWNMVEKALTKSIIENDILGEITMTQEMILKNASSMLKVALKGGLLTPTQTYLLQQLKALRNKVVHSRDLEPSELDAKNYITSALLFVNLLNSERPENNK
jgi:hypothetical protein